MTLTGGLVLVLFANFLTRCFGGSLDDLATAFTKNSLIDAVEFLTPTVNSQNAKCKEDSVFYLEELKKYKSWATEMFDASSKFPTGVVSGSIYDLGNFDECINVGVQSKDTGFQGQYCLAEFKLDFQKQPQTNYDYEKLHSYYNTSVWEKISVLSSDRSKGPRNTVYFSFCIPSSCTYEDLETTINQQLEKMVKMEEFNITASVLPKRCQISHSSSYTTGEIIFSCIAICLILMCIIGTLYHLLTRLDDLKKFQLAGKYHRLMKCFSLRCNLAKLAQKSSSEDGLECIHGMKVLSMFLIIMGHRIMFYIGSPIMNSSFVETFYQKFEATLLLNGPIIVDTFFCISGFLATYHMLLELHKGLKPLKLGIAYIHRIIRLTPAYALVLAFYCTTFFRLGNGPLWEERIGVERDRCLESWWTNILYINNYVNTDKMCMFQSWYLTSDMHLFLLTPLLSWLLWRKPKIGVAATLLLSAGSMISLFTKVYIRREDGILLLYIRLLRDPVLNTHFRSTYIPTHLRASPYLLGILAGYIKYHMKIYGWRIPRRAVYLGWVVCVSLMETTHFLAFLLYLPEYRHYTTFAAFYAAVHHTTWSICICWIIVAISGGHGSWLKPILSWRPLAMLSRITYTAFLCHGAIQLYSAGTLRHAKYVSVFNQMQYTAADIVFAYVAGFILSQICEAPILGLERILRGGHERKELPRSDSIATETTVSKTRSNSIDSILSENSAYSAESDRDRTEGCYTINIASQNNHGKITEKTKC